MIDDFEDSSQSPMLMLVESCDPVTELTIIDMLRYSLEHADKNLPHRHWLAEKVWY